MRKMYLWRVRFGTLLDRIHLVTPGNTMAEALGAAISHAKTKLGDYPEEDTSPSEMTYEGEVMVAPYESK